MDQGVGNRLEFEKRRDGGGQDTPPFRWTPSARPLRFRATRLMCARVYLLGFVASLPTLHRLLGPSFRGIERDVGYDRRSLLFHSFQSLLLSLAFLVPLVFLWAIIPFGGEALPLVTVGCLFTKIAILNPWMAWVYFRRPGSANALRLPLLAGVAQHLSDLALPPSTTASQDTVYFSGARPFVGYGSEVNTWTLVVDTTSKNKGMNAFLPTADEATSVTASELYRAIFDRVRRIQLRDLRVTAGLFLHGESSGEIKELYGYKYGRPPSALAENLARTIDAEGTRGRNYMILQSEAPARDLVVTQFVRFRKEGKLVFCEFASYVLMPVRRGLMLLDRLFELHPTVYALLGGALFVLAALGAMSVSRPFGVSWSSPFLALSALSGAAGWTEFFARALVEGGFARHMVLVSLAVIVAFGLRRLTGMMLGAAGIGLGLRKDLGIVRSYRERESAPTPLEYYDRQEVNRFLKTQEKVLTEALVECLEARGIDTSDLKESLLAFVNQGIINTGEIRGNVTNRIRTLFSRKARERAWSRKVRNVAS